MRYDIILFQRCDRTSGIFFYNNFNMVKYYAHKYQTKTKLVLSLGINVYALCDEVTSHVKCNHSISMDKTVKVHLGNK